MKVKFEGTGQCTRCAGKGKCLKKSGKLGTCPQCLSSGKDIDYWSDDELAKYRHAFVKATLRKASYRWPWRNRAIQQAKGTGLGWYRCRFCNNFVHTSEKKLDHVVPVVDPVAGHEGWDKYSDRLLVHTRGWQVLCTVCHNGKTASERELRQAHNSKRKG